MFRIAINMLIEELFARVLAPNHGGTGSIPGQGMSVLGPIVWDGGDNRGQVSPLR
jgi:hypothetical protein